MTVSVDTRKEHAAALIRTFMSELDKEQKPFRYLFLDVLDYPEILSTTWQELELAGLIREENSTFGGHTRYRLTSQGWIAGLRLTGAFESHELTEKLIQLRIALKARVKGRQHDEAVGLRELASDVNLPQHWIHDVVESGLLQKKFRDDMLRIGWWSPRDASRMIRVPKTFGMEATGFDF